jgi:hypothetical protein
MMTMMVRVCVSSVRLLMWQGAAGKTVHCNLEQRLAQPNDIT